MEEYSFTPEEKTTIADFCNYLFAHGLEFGSFSIYSDWEHNLERNPDKFFNVVRECNIAESEIPMELLAVVHRCLEYCENNMPTIDDVHWNDYGHFEINFDLKFKKTICKFEYETIAFNKTDFIIKVQDDVKLEAILRELSSKGEAGFEVPYSGGGDEGALERVTDKEGNYLEYCTGMEDWCYTVLSNNTSWINDYESNGRFIFSVNKGVCEMEYNSGGLEWTEVPIIEIPFG